jgi:hypothetical protein
VPGGPLPGAFDVPGRAHGEVPSWLQRQDDEENRGEPRVDNEADIVTLDADAVDVALTAELSRDHNDDVLVIEGVKTVDPRVRQCCILLGVLVVASLFSMAAAMITTHLRSRPTTEIGIPSSPQNSTVRPVVYNPLANSTLTIAEAAISADNKGFFPQALFVPPSAWEIFFDKFNRTDRNYTSFTFSSSHTQIFDGLDISLLSKLLTDPWIGHMVSGMQV